MLVRAADLAQANGADWLDLQLALDAVDDPDTVLRDFGYHAYDRWGKVHRGKALSRADRYYEAVVAALEVGDTTTASRSLGLLTHYYTDICSPLHTDGPRRDTRMHRRYEVRVEHLLNGPAGRLLSPQVETFCRSPILRRPSHASV